MCISNVLNISLSVDELENELSTQLQSYLVYSELPAAKAYVQFTGEFESRVVVWNACIRTVKEYAKHHEVADDPKQVIDIWIEEGSYLIDIALNLEQINRAVIERTIIMVRKYKRLRKGRHEYGVRSKTEQV